jgi:hypothetical protein
MTDEAENKGKHRGNPPVGAIAHPGQKGPRLTDPAHRREMLRQEIQSSEHSLGGLERDFFPFSENEKASVLRWLCRQTGRISSLNLNQQEFLACLCVGCELSLRETLQQLPGIAIRSDTLSRYFQRLIRSREDGALFVQERTKYAILLTENPDQAARRRGYDILLDTSKTPSDWHFLSDLLGEPAVFNELGPDHINLFLARCPARVIPQRFFETLKMHFQTALAAASKYDKTTSKRIKLLFATTERFGSQSDLLALAHFFWEWFTFDAPPFLVEKTRNILPADHPFLQPRNEKTVQTLLSEATTCGWTVLKSDHQKLVLDKGGRRVHYYFPVDSLPEDESTDPETPEPKRSP